MAQDATKLIEKGVNKAKKGKYEKAVELFSKAIEVDPNNFKAWHLRGVSKAIQNLHEEALSDFDRALSIYPEFKNGYLNRGITKMELTDYQGSIDDFTKAISLDPALKEAYYERGIIYEMLGKRDSACNDFGRANEAGHPYARRKVDQCIDTAETKYFALLRLTKTSENKDYGFTPQSPVKVGKAPGGGPGNSYRYLDLLRGPTGKPITYVRLGSCCSYDSENGFNGKALLDSYEIKFINENGKKEKTVIYITFYDFEEPKIVNGFRTVGQR